MRKMAEHANAVWKSAEMYISQKLENFQRPKAYRDKLAAAWEVNLRHAKQVHSTSVSSWFSTQASIHLGTGNMLCTRYSTNKMPALSKNVYYVHISAATGVHTLSNRHSRNPPRYSSTFLSYDALHSNLLASTLNIHDQKSKIAISNSGQALSTGGQQTKIRHLARVQKVKSRAGPCQSSQPQDSRRSISHIGKTVARTRPVCSFKTPSPNLLFSVCRHTAPYSALSTPCRRPRRPSRP